MNIDVVIPTRDRLGKLMVCLESLRGVVDDPKGKITVYFASAEEVAKFQCQAPVLASWVDSRVFVEYTAPHLWNFHLATMEADAMMYLNDDVALHEGTYWLAKSQFAYHFPDTDGVLGMEQANLVGRFDTAPAAFGIVGRKFAQRFPQMQAFCPEYHHLWIDRELEMAAREWGRFYYSRKARLDHFHPCVDGKYADETHNHIRVHKDRDKAVWEARKAKGLIWGPSWELVHLS
jgi:hypothetical protein